LFTNFGKLFTNNVHLKVKKGGLLVDIVHELGNMFTNNVHQDRFDDHVTLMYHMKFDFRKVIIIC